MMDFFKEPVPGQTEVGMQVEHEEGREIGHDGLCNVFAPSLLSKTDQDLILLSPTEEM